ncbi:MAG: hypothetical protein JEZ06_06595 [Anaerolineaceae bacterium]|nr:hypothetical protein [Anaerolineaceae bacterium]
MPLNWTDISRLSFNTLLLLEKEQINWFPLFNLPKNVFSTALRGNPIIEWFLRNKNPEINNWLDELLQEYPELWVRKYWKQVKVR